MQSVSVPRQVDPHTGTDAANDPTLMVICHVGAGHPRPFPRAIRGYRYMYVTVDKFTKWPKATPVVKINKKSGVDFINSIVYRFRVQNSIITDHGS
jgi:hypothetical protein